MKIGLYILFSILFFPDYSFGQSRNNKPLDSVSYLTDFYKQTIDKLAFIKQTPNQLIIQYSAEGGFAYNQVIEYRPETTELIIYQYDSSFPKKVRHFKTKSEITDEKLKNEFNVIWATMNLMTLETLDQYCKRTWISSNSIIVKVSSGQGTNYFMTSYTDLRDCKSDKAEFQRQIFKLTEEIISAYCR